MHMMIVALAARAKAPSKFAIDDTILASRRFRDFWKDEISSLPMNGAKHQNAQLTMGKPPGRRVADLAQSVDTALFFDHLSHIRNGLLAD